jgi:hypothetical protein
MQYEALVTPGNELNVHHFLLYRCKVNNPDQYDGKASTCYDKNRILPYCSNMIAAWAIGGEVRNSLRKIEQIKHFTLFQFYLYFPSFLVVGHLIRYVFCNERLILK